MAAEDQAPHFISDFLARLEDPDSKIHTPNGPLQHYLDVMIQDIHALDKQKGNGGAEVHKEMRKHEFTNPSPYDPAVATVKAYLSFRHQNVCAGFVFACVKFSIASSADLTKPSIQKFMTWAADHLSIVNDLYSYEKEARAFQRGSSPDVINIVAVLQQNLGLPDEESAIEMAYLMILQREQWMRKELERIQSDADTDEEIWEFLRAVWACLGGNAMYSMTCERYGGKKARIEEGELNVNTNGKANGNETGNGRLVGKAL